MAPKKKSKTPAEPVNIKPVVKYIVILDKVNGMVPEDSERRIVSATDFISNEMNSDEPRSRTVKVINLCNNYDYLSKGYYCSLLAEARGMRCVPSVSNVISLNWKRHYQSSIPELNGLLEKHYREPPSEPLSRTFTVYFGRIESESLEPVARRLFDLFRFPLLTMEVRFNNSGKWVLEEVKPLSISDLPKEKHDFFAECMTWFTGSAWKSMSTGKKEKHWIAILHDPQEKNPPSNKAALQKFARIGKDMNIYIEFLTRQDYASLLEYDALFIRETTAINHHTYRFANKAESENIPCIDDTTSIIRCCNKVFQHELLASHRIPVPRTEIVDRRTDKKTIAEFEYPGIMKIPDGAFSRGVIKVDSPEAFQEASHELLKKSDIILYQEFIPSAFDWRIGILNNEPLFACKYYMAHGHWQVYNHSARTIRRRVGRHTTLPIEDAPDKVVKTALRAAKLIGDGFYGVDLKESDGRVVVIEVNDNPSIDHGVEDQVLKDGLYKKILEHLVRMIEA